MATDMWIRFSLTNHFGMILTLRCCSLSLSAFFVSWFCNCLCILCPGWRILYFSLCSLCFAWLSMVHSLARLLQGLWSSILNIGNTRRLMERVQSEAPFSITPLTKIPFFSHLGKNELLFWGQLTLVFGRFSLKRFTNSAFRADNATLPGSKSTVLIEFTKTLELTCRYCSCQSAV